MSTSSLYAALLILITGSLATSSAQVWTPMPAPRIDMQNQIWRTFRIGQIGNQVAADMARSRGNGSANSPKPGIGKPATTSVYDKRFAFQRAANSPLAAKMAGQATGDMAKMQQIIDYAWANYKTSFADENGRLGMPFNDVAAALTYYIVGGYLYANDLAGVQSEYSVEVYKQLAAVFAKDPEFSNLTASDKQMLAELLVTMGGMPVLAFKQRRNKQDQIAAGKSNLERIFGPGAAKLQITKNGLEF